MRDPELKPLTAAGGTYPVEPRADILQAGEDSSIDSAGAGLFQSTTSWSPSWPGTQIQPIKSLVPVGAAPSTVYATARKR